MPSFSAQSISRSPPVIQWCLSNLFSQISDQVIMQGLLSLSWFFGFLNLEQLPLPPLLSSVMLTFFKNAHSLFYRMCFSQWRGLLKWPESNCVFQMVIWKFCLSDLGFWPIESRSGYMMWGRDLISPFSISIISNPSSRCERSIPSPVTCSTASAYDFRLCICPYSDMWCYSYYICRNIHKTNRF